MVDLYLPYTRAKITVATLYLIISDDLKHYIDSFFGISLAIPSKITKKWI